MVVCFIADKISTFFDRSPFPHSERYAPDAPFRGSSSGMRSLMRDGFSGPPAGSGRFAWPKTGRGNRAERAVRSRQRRGGREIFGFPFGASAPEAGSSRELQAVRRNEASGRYGSGASPVRMKRGRGGRRLPALFGVGNVARRLFPGRPVEHFEGLQHRIVHHVVVGVEAGLLQRGVAADVGA